MENFEGKKEGMVYPKGHLDSDQMMSPEELKVKYTKAGTPDERIEYLEKWNKKSRQELEKARNQKDLDFVESRAHSGLKKEIKDKRILFIKEVITLSDLMEMHYLTNRIDSDPDIKKIFYDKWYAMALKKFEEAEKETDIFLKIEKLKNIPDTSPNIKDLRMLEYASEEKKRDLKMEALHRLGELKADYYEKREKLENIIKTRPKGSYSEDDVQIRLKKTEEILAKLDETSN
ncbi:MAG: hypothetical protein WCX27_02210 [Candidatus Paceibacterota bacterium]|jgi:hypothetical protein